MRKYYQKEREERATAIVVTATYKANRSDELLEFLLRKCNTSRNNVKNLLVRKQVLVNGSVVTQYDYPLSKDDEIKISKHPVRDGGSARRPLPARKKSDEPTVKIIYEDEDFIAVDKPCGLLSVENEKQNACAYKQVASYLQKAGKNVRPYILHRIDKETSGVLVFAKNIKVHSALRLHWNERVALREYVAVVEGVFEDKQSTVTSYLKENANNMTYVTKDPSGQKAITHYQVEKESAEYSLLRVKIDTGRKNQIRVQMQSLGHTVVGDDKYGHAKNPLKRLGLHASKLSFTHPFTQELITVSSSVPAEFYSLFTK